MRELMVDTEDVESARDLVNELASRGFGDSGWDTTRVLRWLGDMTPPVRIRFLSPRPHTYHISSGHSIRSGTLTVSAFREYHLDYNSY